MTEPGTVKCRVALGLGLLAAATIALVTGIMPAAKAANTATATATPTASPAVGAAMLVFGGWLVLAAVRRRGGQSAA
jgi:hypothetical protein